MNALTKHEGGALTLPENEMIEVLSLSLYPGASPYSIKMVLSYCTAAGLDPMLKPVHIVPMKVKTGEKWPDGGDKTELRDVVMPGVGLYRIQAARTGQYAGIDKPVFGPTAKMEYKRKRKRWVEGRNGRRVPEDYYEDVVLEYPEWCEVTVYRMVGGTRCPFTAIEYWTENYASVGDGDTPNQMWAKRVRGQLAKCAEAQALRKGFPDAVGSQPTAEEMEGKSMEIDMPESAPATRPAEKPAEPQDSGALPAYPQAKFDENLANWRARINANNCTADDIIALVSSRWTLSEKQMAMIRGDIEDAAEVAQENHS